MRRALFICAFLAGLIQPAAARRFPRAQKTADAPASASASKPVPIDGIAVRIESDIITDSQVDELAAYQKLVNGKSNPRAEVIRELIDQWIVSGEATATQYPKPFPADLDRNFAQLEKRIGSPADFEKRCADAGISVRAVRGILTEQIYLSRFLDFRFRPAAQVDAKQVQKYYQDVLAPQLKAKGEKAPSIADVEPEIREVLVQQDIDALSKQWLDDTRGGLTIDILSQGARQ
ncbi:MAG: hypothetical protein ACRD5K_04650 [Candidatus Acidiferrales bacterium]